MISKDGYGGKKNGHYTSWTDNGIFESLDIMSYVTCNLFMSH